MYCTTGKFYIRALPYRYVSGSPSFSCRQRLGWAGNIVQHALFVVAYRSHRRSGQVSARGWVEKEHWRVWVVLNSGLHYGRGRGHATISVVSAWPRKVGVDFQRSSSYPCNPVGNGKSASPPHVQDSGTFSGPLGCKYFALDMYNRFSPLRTLYNIIRRARCMKSSKTLKPGNIQTNATSLVDVFPSLLALIIKSPLFSSVWV